MPNGTTLCEKLDFRVAKFKGEISITFVDGALVGWVIGEKDNAKNYNPWRSVDAQDVETIRGLFAQFKPPVPTHKRAVG